MTGAANRKFSIKVCKLEDVVSPDLMRDYEIPPTDMPQEAIEWLQKACDVILENPLMKPSEINLEFPEGDCTDIEVIICSQQSGPNLFEASDKALGLHVINTPDADPFGEESAFARKARVAVFWDPQAATDFILGDAITLMELESNAISWLGTLTHELQHVMMFMENSNFNTPNDVDILGEEVGRDIFDVSTSYGIRTLTVSGVECDGEDAVDQHALMEEYVEQQGMRIAEDVFREDLSFETFLKVAGIEQAVKQEVAFLFDDYRSSSVAP